MKQRMSQVTQTTTLTKKEVLLALEKKLEYHPGDAPWGCVKCYHGRPCVDAVILRAAYKHLNVKEHQEWRLTNKAGFLGNGEKCCNGQCDGACTR